MSFHETARDIRIEEGHILIAELQDDEGNFVHAQVDLNMFLGNDEGMLTQFTTEK